MQQRLVRKNIYVKKSTVSGYGVFAGEDIKPNEMIEECCLLLRDTIDEEFMNVYFSTPAKKGYILPLGFGAIYNHSKDPNADYEFDPLNLLFRFIANRHIKKDDEIFIFYSPLWFQSRKLKEIERFRYKVRSFRPIYYLLFRFALVVGFLIALILFLKRMR